jgi:hypothetical protein
MKTSKYALLLLLAILLPSIANAAFPIGYWRLDQYDFITKAHINTNVACLYGDGTAAFGSQVINPEWRGNWKRNGDLILLKANNVDGTHVSTYSILASNLKLMTSYGQSWNISLGTSIESYYVNTVWTFINSTSCIVIL